MVSKVDLIIAEPRLHEEIRDLEKDLREEFRSAGVNVGKPDSGKKHVRAKGSNRILE
jgi:hypothetical protein